MSGPQCCSNPPILDPSSGVGHVEKVAGFDTYLTGSPHPKCAVLLASDIFGYEVPNFRKLGDKIAAEGYYVVVPDFFHGDPVPPENASKPLDSWLPAWLSAHQPDKGIEVAKPVIEALKGKGVSSIGTVGFCWGAKVVVELAKSGLVNAGVILHPAFVTVDDFKAKVVVELAKSGLVNAGVILHPAFVTVDDFKGIDVPISILGAEIDRISPPAVIKQFEEILSANPAVDSFVKIFPKVEHGWTTRYDAEDAEAAKVADEAHQDLLAWFVKHLK